SPTGPRHGRAGGCTTSPASVTMATVRRRARLPVAPLFAVERRRLGSGAPLHQAHIGGRDSRLGAVARLERLEDGGDVDLHRAFGEAEGIGDLLVRLAVADERQDVTLAARQARRVVRLD